MDVMTGGMDVFDWLFWRSQFRDLDKIENTNKVDPCPTFISTGPETTRSCFTHYCIVRKDLSRGLLAAQLVHAAGESSPGNLPENTAAVVLAVPGESELLAVEQTLQTRAVPHRAIRETVG
jgi:hypothetical protein